MMLSRRRLLLAGAALSSTAVLGATDAGLPPVGDGPKPLDLMRLAKKAYERAHAFATERDSGLLYLTPNTAFAAAQVTERLGAMLAAVVEFKNLVSKMPASARDGLPIRLDDPRFESLMKAGVRYWAHTRAAAADPSVWTLPRVKDELCQLKEAVTEWREAVVRESTGFFLGLEAALFAPIALAVEIGSALRAEANLGPLRGTLDSYDRWVTRMATEAEGSIPSRRLRATLGHDGALGELKDSRVGRRLELGNFMLAGSQQGRRVADPCVIFSKAWVSWDDLDERNGLEVPARTRDVRNGGAQNVVIRESRLYVRDGEDLGIRVIAFDEGAHMNYSSASHWLFWPGVNGRYCYVGRTERVLSGEQAIAETTKLLGVADDENVRMRIRAAIESANLARATIALSGEALLLREGTLSKIAYLGRQLP